MTTRPLVIGEDTRARARAVKEYAEAHPYNLHTIMRLMDGHHNELTAGDNPEHAMDIPVGFRLVYSIEQHPSGWHHHFSISVNTVGKTPHPMAAQEILRLFIDGVTIEQAASIWEEDAGAGHTAINLLFKK